MIGIFVVLLALIGLVATLFVLVKNKTAPKSGTAAAPATASPKAPAKPGSTNEGWWVRPLVLWLLFWSILLFLFPSMWQIMWGNRALFCIVHIAYFGMAYGGKDQVNLKGKPEKPLYLSILSFAIFCLIVGAIWKEAAKVSISAAPSKVVPTVQAVVPTASTPAKVAQATPPALPPPIQYETSFVVKVDEISTVTIPAGYIILKTDGIERVNAKRTELPDGKEEWKYTVKGVTPVYVTIWYARGIKNESCN